MRVLVILLALTGCMEARQAADAIGAAADSYALGWKRAACGVTLGGAGRVLTQEEVDAAMRMCHAKPLRVTVPE